MRLLFLIRIIPTYVYGNHDQMRYIDKIEHNPEKAKLLALFQFTARGVPIVYYGEEIGIKDANIPNAEGKDPIAQQNAFIPNFIVNAFGIYLTAIIAGPRCSGIALPMLDFANQM
jgi:glycosidase